MAGDDNERPAPDGVLVDIAGYVLNDRVDGAHACETARRFVERRRRPVLDLSLEQATREAMPVHDPVDLHCS
jgi:hypothetical protein